MKNLKVVTIDFWNTLFDSSNGEQRNKYRLKAIVTEMDKTGYIVKKEQLEDAMKASWEYFNEIWVNEMKTPDPKDVVIFFWDYLKAPKNDEAIEQVVQAFAKSIIVYPPSLINGVYDALLELRKKYSLAIVSDTGFSPGSILRELLVTANIIDFFEAFSFSNETGVAKPQERAFLTVLNKLNCKPENALHIGDIEQTDIFGAKNLGMKAIKYIGDPAPFYPESNNAVTIADFECTTWDCIVDKITND